MLEIVEIFGGNHQRGDDDYDTCHCSSFYPCFSSYGACSCEPNHPQENYIRWDHYSIVPATVQ